MALGNGNGSRRYLLASSAPGPVTAVPQDDPVDGLPDRLTAQWQEDGGGYRIELRVPRTPDLDQLGVGIFDPSHREADPLAAPVRPLLAFSSLLSTELGELAPEGVRVRLLAPQAWLLAQKPWIVPIPGTTKLHRLEENLGGARVALTADDLKAIHDAVSAIDVQGDRYPASYQTLMSRLQGK